MLLSVDFLQKKMMNCRKSTAMDSGLQDLCKDTTFGVTSSVAFEKFEFAKWYRRG